MAGTISMAVQKKLRIGTRGSALALYQANEVCRRIIAAHPEHLLEVEIKVISTRGDRVQDRALSEIGGKGLFTQEIEEQLSDGRIDLAVHSSKDMPARLPDGLELACFLKREHASDALVSHGIGSLDALPQGATVGSSSLRRKALLLRKRPDLNVTGFRGNVGTRLQKLAEGLVIATLLAEAGLRRLGLEKHISAVLDPETFPPAPGQGAIGIEIRTGDSAARALLAPINDPDTQIALACERAFLAGLDGSCRTPIAGHAQAGPGRLLFHGMILTPDGREAHEIRLEGSNGDAAAIGMEAAERLRQAAGARFFESWV